MASEGSRNPLPNLAPSPGYGSFDDLFNAVQAFGRQNGLAVRKSSMNSDIINGIKQPRWGWLDCDRGGRPRVLRGVEFDKPVHEKPTALTD